MRLPAPLILRGLLLALLLTPIACQSPARMDPALEEAIAWYLGTPGRVDDQRAAELLQQAQTSGDALSIMWLARVYSTGRMGYPMDKARARSIADAVIDEIESRADAGAAEAQFLMGTAYAEGLGKPVDPQQAVAWYRRAAARGHVLAQHNVGNVYFSGTGVEQSDAQAVYWWTLAAGQGDAIPQFRLGEMYESGRGVERDLQQALYWYRESARRGNDNARAALLRLGSQESIRP